MSSSDATKDARVGDIMTLCKFISQEDLEQSLQLAAIAGIPLGKALVYMKFATEQQIQDVLTVQKMIKNGLISLDGGRFVLQTVEYLKIPFQQALEVSYLDPSNTESHKFGNILKVLGVSTFKIKLALKIAKKSGKQIGEVAVKIGVITEDTQKLAVRIQKAVRKLKNPIVQPSEKEKEMRFRLGDLLVQAGCIDRETIEKSLKEKISSTQSVGNYLLEKNLISSSLLNYALGLLCLIKKNRLSVLYACKCLKNFASVQSNYHVLDFLKAGNYLCEKDEDRLIAILDQNTSLSRQLLKSLTTKEMAECCDSQMLLSLAYRDEESMRTLLYELAPENKELIDSALFFYTLAQGKKMTLNQALVNFAIRTKQISMAERKIA